MAINGDMEKGTEKITSYSGVDVKEEIKDRIKKEEEEGK